jgi:hypothetical protein
MSYPVQGVQLTQKPAEHDEGPQSPDKNIVALLRSLLCFHFCLLRSMPLYVSG